MRVHVAYIQGGFLRDYERSYVPMVQEAIRTQGQEHGVHLEEDPAKADLIILWEGFQYKTPQYIERLENDPLIKCHTDRVAVINYDDHPEGFLRGLYTSLEPPFFDSSLHRIWPFMLMNNPLVAGLAREEVDPCVPQYLFSFAGAASHPVRQRLFATFHSPSPRYHITHVNKWYNHNEKERRQFIDLALSSRFCLCPHGYCAYTPRITEVMAMARVPVIIADDWIPFSFPESEPYYLKVPEREIAGLPDYLESQCSIADTYRHNARRLWEKYCAPQRSILAAVNALTSLVQNTASRRTFPEYRERWHSHTFRTQLGWTLPQRLALRAEQRVRRWIPAIKVPGVSPLMRYRNASHSA